MSEFPISDKAVEAAMRAAYEGWPEWMAETFAGGQGRRPKTYEECYGCSPLDHTDDVNEMRVALAAFLTAEGAAFYPSYPCNCDDGEIEEGPPGATYTVMHDRCNGTGRLQRVIIERPSGGRG